MDEQNVGFEDFMGAFEDSADYHTDTIEESEMEQDPQESEELATEDGAEAGEPEAEEVSTEEAEKEAPKTDDQETFTLKVNKEERTYSREEVITLAQKGADYDRVKEQLGKSQQTATELQDRLTQLAPNLEHIAVLESLAKEMGSDIPKLLDSLRLSSYRKQGLSEDAANERLLRVKAEFENEKLRKDKAALPAEDKSKQKVQQDLADFRKSYPDVALTEELLKELMPEIQKGVPMLQAYRNREIASKDAVIAEKDQKIAQLERQIEAEKQNKNNRASSPGSQKDSGGKRTKNEFDDFLDAFN